MLTPEQERALLDATAAGLDDDLRAAYAEFLRRVRAGEAPRDAVTAVMGQFAGTMAETMAAAFGAILARSVGSADVMKIEVGGMALSDKLYAQAREVSQIVQGIVDRHAQGWQDARKLALELYEGYGFRKPGDEPLQINRNNPLLPRYLREVLLPISELSDDLRKHLARLQADNLSTQALRAAYLDVLRAIDAMEEGAGAEAVEKALRVAYYEKVRYQATRIALTDLHRAYAEARAREMMDDPEVQWVQWRMSATHPITDICDYLATVDKWGMGPGVYPVGQAPVPPAHPHCLTGDAFISAAGKIAGVSKRWFDGDVVVVTTASGKRISATVNHPILTRRGWVGAGLLDVGDEVISRIESVGVQGLSFAHDEHQHVPPRIAEIADAFFSSRKVTAREVPISAEDFHGDGEGSEVAVIGADRKLWNSIDAARPEVGRNHFLSGTHAGAACHLGNGIFDLRREALFCPPDGVVRAGGEGGSLVGGKLRHSDAVSLAHSPPLLASPYKAQINDVSADAELARQIQNGSTGPVFADKVIDIERNAWRGHVYNLETEQGHYTANGIITHNCRCILAPRLDLYGRQGLERPDAAQAVFRRAPDLRTAARIAGSREKLERVLSGEDTLAVYNTNTDPLYRIKLSGSLR
jgi:hypothetical protein